MGGGEMTRALRRTFDRTVCVFRPLPDGTERTVYIDVPCALSRNALTSAPAVRGAEEALTESRYALSLYTMPEIWLRLGDRVAVSDKTHMSFRTRYAAAAERNKKHTKSSEAPAPPYCSQKVGFPRQSGGQGACPLCFSGGRAGGGLFQKRPSLANRQRASALFVSCAALGTLL